MKKYIALLILLTLSLGLCACGGGTEDIELPTRPQQSLPNDAIQIATTEQSDESQDLTGETYPWETEFNEEDYVKFEFTAPDGEKITTWREGTILGREARQIYEWTDGTIEDSYYYPSGNKSHSYKWGADGSYSEMYFLDDGYTDLAKHTTYSGTVIHEKTISADGAEFEMNCDENGVVSFTATKEADGTYSEYSYFPNGNPSKNICDNPNTGEHSEYEYYENGNTRRTFYSNTSTGEHSEYEYYENGNARKVISDNSNTGEYSEYEYYENGNARKVISDNPNTGEYYENEFFENGNVKYSVHKDSTDYYTEQEYFDNGSLKYTKIQSPEYTMEERYNEEGFRTYFYSKDANYEIELIADETGKLIKFTENGKVYENEAIPGHIAGSYNFRE